MFILNTTINCQSTRLFYHKPLKKNRKERQEEEKKEKQIKKSISNKPLQDKQIERKERKMNNNLEIRKAMLEMNIKQYQLAELLNMSPNGLILKMRKELSQEEKEKIVKLMKESQQERKDK